MQLFSNVKKGEEVFVAPNATVIGQVSLGDESSIWYGAVLRADNDSIEVGSRSNVQDNAVIHVDPGCPVKIGESCIIGHGAIVHGATLQDHVLVGMNAVILNNAVVGEYSIIGANALVTTGMVIPPRSLVLGSPAKVVKVLTEQQCKDIERNADVYVKKAKEFILAYAQYQSDL